MFLWTSQRRQGSDYLGWIIALDLSSAHTSHADLQNGNSEPYLPSQTGQENEASLWGMGRGSLSRKVKWKSLNPVQLFAIPWTTALQAPLLLDSPGKNTGASCFFLLQGIFLTQRSIPHLLHCRQILYCLSREVRTLHQGNCIIIWLYTECSLGDTTLLEEWERIRTGNDQDDGMSWVYVHPSRAGDTDAPWPLKWLIWSADIIHSNSWCSQDI